MVHSIETFVEKLKSPLTQEHRDLLLSLYEILHVDDLHEEEQNSFIEYFFSSDKLQNITVLALDLVEIIHELQENIPAIEPEEHLANDEERNYFERKRHDAKRNELKHPIMKQGNVFYVPFAEYKKETGPIIICLEQTEGMSMYSEICKSMILPWFITAYREQRDLYIVPYNCQIDVHYHFVKGRLNFQDFTAFIECDLDGEAAIIPVLHFIKGLVQENAQCTDVDVILFTEGEQIDGERLVEPNVKTMVQEMINEYQIDFSVIVMQGKNDNAQYFWFANNVFLAEGTTY